MADQWKQAAGDKVQDSSMVTSLCGYMDPAIGCAVLQPWLLQHVLGV